MKKMFSPIVTPSTAIALLLAAGSVQGATITWDDGGASPTSAVDGTSSVWNTSSAVWSNGTTDSAWVNANNDIAVFGNQHGTAGTVNLGSNITAGGLVFNAATSGNYTIAPGTGAYTLTLAGGATITTNVDATISAAIAGNSGLIKNGTGTLTLSSSNSYTGLTKISQGMLIVSASNGLGPISSGTVAIDGGALRYTVNGTIGTLSAGLNGVTVEENTASTTLTINNLVYSGAGDRTLVFGGAAGSVSVNTAIKDSGGVTSLVKNGAGTLVLTGSSTYTGATYINGGLFRTNTINGLSSLTTVYLAKGATFDMTSGTQTIGALMDGTDGNGGGRVSVNKTGIFPLIVGSGNFSGLINDWQAGTKLMQLTKTGPGTLTLSGTSAYSGTTSVTGGSLKLTSVKAMNYGAVLGLGVSVAPTAVSGGNLDLSMNGTVNQVVTLNGGGLINSTAGTAATLDNGVAGVYFSNGGTGYTGNGLTFTGGGGSGASGTYTLSSGSITGIGMTAGGTGYTSAPTVTGSGNGASGLQATAVLSSVSLTGNSNTIGGDGNLIIAAVISGANGGFTKAGTGTLTLKGANTYTGVTDIAAGKLALASGGSIANSATIKVGLSANFDVSAISGFTVGGSQRLDNNGSITGNVSVAGTLSGNGTISNGLSLLPASTLDLQLNKSGNTHDTVTVLAGDVSLAGTLNLLLNGGSLQVGTGLVLVVNSGNGALTESFTDVTIGGVSVGNYTDHTFTYGGQEYLLQSTVANGDGHSNDLEIIAVPEPNTWGLILGGTGVLVGLQRLRRANRRLV